MAVAITFTDAAADTAPASATVTFSARSLGTASSDRLIVVGASGGNSTEEPTALTVQAISATKAVGTNDADQSGAGIWVASVPTGTTGDIVITYPTKPPNAGIVVWAMTGANSTASSTATDITATASALSASLTINASGGAVGYCVSQPTLGGPSTHVWTNLTEDADTTIEGGLAHTGAHSTTSGTSTRTVTASGGTTPMGKAHLLLLAAFDAGSATFGDGIGTATGDSTGSATANDLADMAGSASGDATASAGGTVAGSGDGAAQGDSAVSGTFTALADFYGSSSGDAITAGVADYGEASGEAQGDAIADATSSAARFTSPLTSTSTRARRGRTSTSIRATKTGTTAP